MYQAEDQDLPKQHVSPSLSHELQEPTQNQEYRRLAFGGLVSPKRMMHLKWNINPQGLYYSSRLFTPLVSEEGLVSSFKLSKRASIRRP